MFNQKFDSLSGVFGSQVTVRRPTARNEPKISILWQMAHRILTIFTYIVFEAMMILSTKQDLILLDSKSIKFFIEIQISRFWLLTPMRTAEFNSIKNFSTF